jgi:hypothetical protein
MELLRLRVKDVDLARLQVSVRAGKGDDETHGTRAGHSRDTRVHNFHAPESAACLRQAS